MNLRGAFTNRKLTGISVGCQEHYFYENSCLVYCSLSKKMSFIGALTNRKLTGISVQYQEHFFKKNLYLVHC